MKTLSKPKLKRKENWKFLKTNGSSTKKKLLLKKRLLEKNSFLKVCLNLMPLRRKILLPKVPDLRPEKLRECIEEHSKQKREQVPSIKQS